MEFVRNQEDPHTTAKETLLQVYAEQDYKFV